MPKSNNNRTKTSRNKVEIWCVWSNERIVFFLGGGQGGLYRHGIHLLMSGKRWTSFLKLFRGWIPPEGIRVGKLCLCVLVRSLVEGCSDEQASQPALGRFPGNQLVLFLNYGPYVLPKVVPFTPIYVGQLKREVLLLSIESSMLGESP